MKTLTSPIERPPLSTLKHIIADQYEAFQPYLTDPKYGLFVGLLEPVGVKLAFCATLPNFDDRHAG